MCKRLFLSLYKLRVCVCTLDADGCSKRKCFRSADVEPPLQENFCPQISHEACLPSSRPLHDFHTSLSLLRFAIYNTRCCTVALRNLRKLYPNDVTKFCQLMQNCKLVAIHRNKCKNCSLSRLQLITAKGHIENSKNNER